jgi:ribonuclease HI
LAPKVLILFYLLLVGNTKDQMAKKKFYVVWQGHTPGIYESWTECLLQVKGFPGARYQSFKSLAEAEAAFSAGPSSSSTKAKKPPKNRLTDLSNANIEWKSISVDAACSGNPGPMEYQGVDTATGDQIFHQQFPLGTNNIGEFLALVHALALLKNQKSDQPIYTDSRIAIGWVKRKTCRSKLPRNRKTARLFELVDRAEKWLHANTYSTRILKWDTESWGEIPADFGRK